ncbi:innexin inx2 [Procambarus clarkii]|uniref:innexin inx2 n=1 Tax=Procambarus clarkii TaxID=6728 RepID=UPI0037443678
MAPSFGGGMDIRSLLATVVNLIKSRANQVCTATCDGLVLRMHYRWTFCFHLGQFLSVWYSWYYRSVITCVSHFNAETQIRLDYMNICLSYPYVDDNGTRRYLLYYRWVSWSFLLLAAVYYIPRKASKILDNTRCKKLIEDLASQAPRYDLTERELVERAARYIFYNLRTHDGLYWKYLSVNVLALMVDIFSIFFIDFILQGRFIKYGFMSYPFERDPWKFTDYMSQTFPPFASCELTPTNKLVNKRNEKFGCHLTIMELYEKVFLGLWLWLIVLTFVTCCYIVYLVLMWVPCVQVYILRTAKPAHANDRVRQLVQSVARNCKIGDIYLLYRLRQHLSHARFYELMTRLSEPNLLEMMTSPQAGGPSDTRGKLTPISQADSMRGRRPQDPGMNPKYLHQLLDNSDMMTRHPHHPYQRHPRLKNTNIFIE